jgi:RNA polymerase sigma-70 factor (ECF subfamily)
MNYHNSLPDEKLIQVYLNGDPNALAILAELHKDRIYQSIYSIVQDKYVAEEIFHEVFIRIINNQMAGRHPEENNFLQWAQQIARNLCIEYSRKTRHAVVEIINASKEETVHFPLPAPQQHANYYESHGKIKSMIDMLPEDQREVIVLNHYGGLSLKEIAGIMKCSLNSALDTMRFGLNNLWKLMAEKEIVLQ